MGYRDDNAALLSHCEALEAEVAALRRTAQQAEQHEQELRHTLRRLRWRLRLRGVWRWMGRHKVLVAIALTAVALPTYCELKNRAEESRLREARESELRRLGCAARLKVVSHPSGAAVHTTARLGETPLDALVCGGAQLVRVIHPRMLPWQRVVDVPRNGQASVAAALIPWHPGDRPTDAALIHSRPDGAVVFVDGREVGRTPLLVPVSREGRRTVALWAEGHDPLIVRARASHTMWFYLRQVAGAEKAHVPR
jgi:hypothetical protein